MADPVPVDPVDVEDAMPLPTDPKAIDGAPFGAAGVTRHTTRRLKAPLGRLGALSGREETPC
jgi:hypothetical protein